MNFKLRELKEKDIPLMLEWMRKPDVNDYFRFNSDNATYENVRNFIQNSHTSANDKHFAITNDEDEYLGTVSLKNIDYTSNNAEFAIALRPDFRGKGVGTFAVYSMLEYAFKKLNLNKVFLNVYSDNTAAVKLYEKIGFICEGVFKSHIYANGKYKNLKWYAITRGEYDKHIDMRFSTLMPTVNDVKLIRFSQHGDNRGRLVVIESGKTIPFEIKRVFYTYGSSIDAIRGQHANRFTDFILINVSGTSKVKVIDGDNASRIVDLSEPHSGVYLPHMLWKDMYDFSEDSILLVLASTHYDGLEYIRDFDEFIAISNSKQI